MEELQVGQVFIPKQKETSKNYESFLEIASTRMINVKIVHAGERIVLENDLYFDILWPLDKQEISDNLLNNNAMVLKLKYKDFSMLFTGDIEEIAEKAILKVYNENTKILQSTVLKVAHHRK